MSGTTVFAYVCATLAVLGTALLLYFLPAIVAHCRRVRRLGAIFTLNLLLGWTFFGWAAALVWALAEEKA